MPGGYWNAAEGRYVTANEAEGRRRPFDRNREGRVAVAKDLVRFGQPEEGFANAGGEQDLLKAAARQMVEMTRAGADPAAISARLAEDRAAYGVNEARRSLSERRTRRRPRRGGRLRAGRDPPRARSRRDAIGVRAVAG